VRPEPHPLTAAGALKRCSSSAKPDVQNRTIKKKQVLQSRIMLMRLGVKNFDAGARAGAASRCGYGSTKMMRHLAAPASHHWKKQSRHPVLKRVYYVEHQFEAGAVGAALFYCSGSTR
jgi:hypothetical protein